MDLEWILLTSHSSTYQYLKFHHPILIWVDLSKYHYLNSSNSIKYPSSKCNRLPHPYIVNIKVCSSQLEWSNHLKILSRWFLRSEDLLHRITIKWFNRLYHTYRINPRLNLKILKWLKILKTRILKLSLAYLSLLKHFRIPQPQNMF